VRTFRLPIFPTRAAAILIAGAALTAQLHAKSGSTATAAAASSAASPNAAAFANVQIDNFGEINANYFRGAQPQGRDYQALAAAGIKTVIDLTEDGREDEPGLVKQAGMTFYRIPLTTTDRPSDAAVAQFLKLVDDPQNQPVYVHCQGGRHRTGAMTAVYRMTQDGWTADRAYQEMKQYKFEGFPGHPELKSFVYDYYTQVSRPQPGAGAKQ
jgi:tyrosine-protein phosphatase SIW14